MSDNISEDILEKARKRVEAKKGFYIHLAAMIAASILMAFLSFMIGDPFEPWILFPILPMILSLFIHYVIVFGFPFTHIMTEEWEESQLEYETWKIQRRQLPPHMDEELDDELELSRPKVKEKRRVDDDFV